MVPLTCTGGLGNSWRDQVTGGIGMRPSIGVLRGDVCASDEAVSRRAFDREDTDPLPAHGGHMERVMQVSLPVVVERGGAAG